MGKEEEEEVEKVEKEGIKGEGKRKKARKWKIGERNEGKKR